MNVCPSTSSLGPVFREPPEVTEENVLQWEYPQAVSQSAEYRPAPGPAALEEGDLSLYTA